MKIRKIIRMFESGNVCVCGLRGTGKDVLMGNVIARRNKPYVSNLDYTNGKNYQVLDFDKINVGENTYVNLIEGDIKYYEFPYVPESDIYISDAGVYLPSQYCNELNKRYPYLPTYFSLSRQLSHNSVHTNVQFLGRLWDKLREHAGEIYIRCRFCVMPFGKLVYKLKQKPKLQWLERIPLLTFQKITLYDKYQSCLDRVEPCRITVPVMAKKEVKQNAQIYLDKFRNTYGTIKTRYLLYFNKSQHDTYYFEKLFKNGRKETNDEKKQ